MNMFQKYFSTLLTLIFITSSIFSQQVPIDFENNNHVFSGFSGASFSTRNDPDNASNKVGQFNNNGNDANQGFWIDLTRDIDITNQKEIILSFYAFDPNTHTILLKLENGTNADVEVTQSVTSGNANTWQNFTFDFSSAKETTFKKELFDKALSNGKVVVVSSWIKYCTSCASQMKVLDKAKNDFDNIEYFKFDVTNKEIAEFFNIQYQTTLLIFKDNKEVYRSIGETTKELIYDALKSSI